MKITKRRQGETVVFALDGQPAVPGGERAWEAIKAALAAGETRILLDMEQVSKLDSEEVGDLLASHTSARRSGAQMVLVHLSPRVDEVLRITKLIGVLDVYDDEVEALRALEATRPAPRA